MKQLTYLLSALILGISIIISAFVFGNTFADTTSKVNNNSQATSDLIPDLMTKAQLSEYLQISEQSIENIIKKDDFEKAKLSNYDTYRFIPYLKVDNQERFLKAEIDKWLQYKNDHPLLLIH